MTAREKILAGVGEFEIALKSTGYAVPALVIAIDPEHPGTHVVLMANLTHGDGRNLRNMRIACQQVLDDLEHGTLPPGTEKS